MTIQWYTSDALIDHFTKQVTYDRKFIPVILNSAWPLLCTCGIENWKCSQKAYMDMSYFTAQNGNYCTKWKSSKPND